jgi:hypothetical protein
MHARDSVRHGDGQSQERPDRRVGANDLVEGPGLRGLEHQQCLRALTHQLQRPHGPRPIELNLEVTFVRA